MVYIIQAQESENKYRWLCGGALVTRLFIITSADCLENLHYLYAIAGYTKYVDSTKIYTDPCTKNSKKKIVSTSVPKFFESSYPNKRSNLDIAVAEVDSPYQLGLKAEHCTHAPGTIDINYHSKYQAANVDAMVLGWGYSNMVKEPGYYNQEFLHWASVLIVSKKICKATWAKEMGPMIDNYMICTNGKGMLNVWGQLIDDGGEPVQTCIHDKRALNSDAKNIGSTKSNSGFCQNDNGGPLVGWVGGKPILLGVQSAFLRDHDTQCHGPFLYTSTHCNGAFLNCVIKEQKTHMADCNLAGVKLDYDIYKNLIRWSDSHALVRTNYFLRDRKQQLSNSVNAGEHDNTGNNRNKENSEFAGNIDYNPYVGKTGDNSFTNNNENADNNRVTAYTSSNDGYIVSSSNTGNYGNTGNNGFSGNSAYEDYNTMLRDYNNECISDRRILDGAKVFGGNTSYMVYIVKAKEAEVKYKSWLCGGALVTPRWIVTSAACVEDVKYMYAIAGYSKYVNSDQIYDDACTRGNKKKIVTICVPKPYDFMYEKVEKWSNLDIAVVQVESPFDIGGAVKPGCSYSPYPIEINYHKKYQEPGVDAMVLGWGHIDKYRKPEDLTDYNQKDLQWSSVLIVEKKICKDAWNAEMGDIIDKFMICTSGSGMLDFQGRFTGDGSGEAIKDGCNGRRTCNNGTCLKGANETNHKSALHSEMNAEATNNRRVGSQEEKVIPVRKEKRNGICQNDHGGPLVGWVGGKPILLGVQSAFLIDAASYQCRGPFLHTSTHCNGAFLKCIIDKGHTRMAECRSPGAKLDFEIYRRTISWEHHADGPAENELLLMRSPQADFGNTGSTVSNEFAHRTSNNRFAGNIDNNGRSDDKHTASRTRATKFLRLRYIDDRHMGNFTIRVRPQIPLH